MKSQKFRKNRKTIKRATLIGQHTIKGGRKKKYLKNNNRQNQIRRNTRKMRGGTRALLMDNIRSGNIEEVTRILRTGGVELNNIDGMETPLILAVRLKKYDIVRLLLEHGADPNSMAPMRPLGMHGEGTALGNAISIAHVPTARLLLNNRASIEGVCFNDGTRDFTPLDHAVNCSNIQMVRLLLEHGADPNNTVGYSGQMNQAQANVMAILNAYRDALRDHTILPHLMEPRLSDIEREIQREMRQVERETGRERERQVERERPLVRERVTPLVRERVTPLERDPIISEMLIRPNNTPQPINLEEILTEDKLSTLRNLSMNDRSYFLKKQIELLVDWGPSLRFDNIKREDVFNDSMQKRLDLSLNNALIKYNRMSVKFIGEAGADAGGLTKEYFNLVSKDIVDPNKRLFKTYNGGKSYQPDTLGIEVANFVEQYKFIGRLVGKAICSGYTLDELVFNKPFLKHIIEEPIVLEDVRFADCELYNSLMSVSSNSVDGWDLYFTNLVSSPRHNQLNLPPPPSLTQPPPQPPPQALTQDLNDLTRIPSTGAGEHELVNDENKARFIDKKLKYLTTDRIKPQIDAFLEGLYSMIPKKFLKLFTIEELELLISGVQIIDVNIIKEKTTYDGVYRDNKVESDNTIVWFWEILHEEDQEFLKKLLQFVTSSSRIGIYFSFKITKTDEESHYPVAHTCFSQLVLSNYTNKEQLKQMLTFAITQELTFTLV